MLRQIALNTLMLTRVPVQMMSLCGTHVQKPVDTAGNLKVNIF